MSIGATQEVKSKSKLKQKEGIRYTELNDGLAEARLIQIYRMIGESKIREALNNAESLVNDFPNFQLAQLVYGDLLIARTRPLKNIGDVPSELAEKGMQNLIDLRAESQLRFDAIKQMPPLDALPSQFVSLSSQNKHAIAVDTEKARLYLFENTQKGTRLIANYYVSVGKAGVGKTVEGDRRTPLGVYFITSNLDPRSLKDLYGSGALPVNYPNVLDLRRGKTGSGIWLHGTPASQFTRAPLATDGCVAVANPDLERIIKTVAIRTTPVLIAKNLKWVRPDKLASQKNQFSETLQTWTKAKSSGREHELLQFYANDFSAEGKDLTTFSMSLRAELKKAGNKPVSLKDVSLIRWTDEADTMVATFGEIPDGAKIGRTVRQYWQHRPGGWKIIYEGLV
jgi:murein L,D-transpeptidase YafK